MKRMFGCLALAVTAGAASGQQAGDVLFTTLTRTATGGANGDIIGVLDQSLPGSFNTLYTVPETNSRLNRLARAPGQNNFFVGNAPFPPANDRSTGDLWQVSNIFGSATRSTVVSSSTQPELIGPIGVQYNAAADRVIWVNNAIGTGVGAGDIDDGIFGASPNGSNFVDIFQEPPFGPAPTYNAGVEIKADPLRANSYYVTTLNGGDDLTGPGDPQAGTIWRLDLDVSDASNSTMTLITTLDAATTGLSESLTRVQGLTFAPNGDLLIGDKLNEKIYRLGITPDGLGLASAAEIIDLAPIHISAGVTAAGPGDIEYDPFNNALVMVEDIGLNTDLNDRIARINLDGTGYQVLLSDIAVNDVFIVPAPGSLALLGMGGLAALRRRR